MKFFLAKDEPFTFVQDYSLHGYKGKWGQFTMKYQVDEWDLDRFDQRISNVLRKMVDRYPSPSANSTSCNMSVMLLLRDEPERMRKGKLRLGRPEEAFLKDIAALYHQGNLRVNVTLSFPQTCNMLSDADNLADIIYTYISTKEMVVNVECARSCAVGSVLFSSSDVHIPARFLLGESSIKAFLTVEVMLDTEYLRPVTKTKNDSLFEKMFHDEIHSDVTITAGNGREIKCHKSVLSACSPVFGAMFSTDMVEAKTHNVNIREMSETGVKSFLHYIYCQNKDVPKENCEIAFELLNASHKYNVTPDLETAMSTLMLSKPSEWFNVDVAVNVFLFAENIEKYKEALKQKAIQVLQENSTTLRNSETYVQMFRKYPAETVELYELIFGRLSGKPVDSKRRRRWE